MKKKNLFFSSFCAFFLFFYFERLKRKSYKIAEVKGSRVKLRSQGGCATVVRVLNQNTF